MKFKSMILLIIIFLNSNAFAVHSTEYLAYALLHGVNKRKSFSQMQHLFFKDKDYRNLKAQLQKKKKFNTLFYKLLLNRMRSKIKTKSKEAKTTWNKAIHKIRNKRKYLWFKRITIDIKKKNGLNIFILRVFFTKKKDRMKIKV